MTTPSLDEYVQAYLKVMRAPLKEKTVFGPNGRCVVRSRGEQILFGPKGEKIRVIEDPSHNTQIEVGDQLHGVARPQALNLKMSLKQARQFASAVGHPGAITTTMTPRSPQ
jgi:hypothetical protein